MAAATIDATGDGHTSFRRRFKRGQDSTSRSRHLSTSRSCAIPALLLRILLMPWISSCLSAPPPTSFGRVPSPDSSSDTSQVRARSGRQKPRSACMQTFRICDCHPRFECLSTRGRLTARLAFGLHTTTDLIFDTGRRGPQALNLTHHGCSVTYLKHTVTDQSSGRKAGLGASPTLKRHIWKCQRYQVREATIIEFVRFQCSMVLQPLLFLPPSHFGLASYCYIHTPTTFCHL